MTQITPNPRVRQSPFYAATLKEGVTNFTTYNRMLMPTGYGDPEAEYWRLINGVSMWDVAVERQVELIGPDAAQLAQALCVRDLSKCKIGQGKYAPVCNHAGTMINDPIVLKLEEQRFWLSIADADILHWARAVAAEREMNVQVREPDVSPLAVQGPKAEAVIASIFGDWIRGLKYFWFGETTIQDIPVAVARSGWSKQGGFEIYLMDGRKGQALWDLVKEAGAPFDIGPGNPNAVERVESGLVSVGTDTDDVTNPYEMRMGGFVDLHVPDHVIGIKALRQIHQEGPQRHQIGVILDDDKPAPSAALWHDVFRDGVQIGSLTTSCWSYRLKKNIGLALLTADTKPGDRIKIIDDSRNEMEATLTTIPFI